MQITKERVLIDKGSEILMSCLPRIEKVPGYLGWRVVETVEFLPRRGQDVEVRAIYLLVKIAGDTCAKDVICSIEEIEGNAYEDFSKLALHDKLEGRVNIFILMDFEEE